MIDLHIHTIYSDGEYNENEIIEKVKNAGIKEFAICDHDTIEGIFKVFNKIKENNEKLIFHSGVELSCRATNYIKPMNCHILVRDFEYNDEVIINLVEKISCLRKKKISRMVELVKLEYGIQIKKKDIDEILKTTFSFGKPHIYKILSKYGNFNREDFYVCMDKLNTSDLKLSCEEVIKLLKNHKANITLAHPMEVKKEYNLSFIELDNFIKYLKNLGLDSIESKHSSHTNFDCAILTFMADSYNLQETQGSDYHGPNVKPDVILGKCYKN